ncbi:M16 family metallopeptidase [Sphingomonas sp. PB4P5]|uniref:M16 family metallopeptidase n=1 Tax=Parasphingomonas puruogangriensis TaxID=3096155 RepID=UPI002FC7F80A
MTGRLSNGVRFAILPRRGSEPGIGFLVRNEGGFIAERRPGERGLAHLIEHIFFLSPTNKEPDDFRHLVRIGLPLTFPAPNAGSTSWRETNYYLSTKTTAPAEIDTLLSLFRDAATDLTLRADAVDAARAEVVREMADKKLGNEIFADYIAAVAPGSPNDVIEAQNSDDVPTASIDTIRNLYRRLYQPETMMIVIVGDVDAEQVRALIEQRFGTWQPSKPVSRRAPFPVFQRDRIRPISVSALPQGRRTAMMTVVMPTPAPPSTRARQAEADLMDLLAVRAIDGRFAASQPGSPAGKLGMFIESSEGHRQIMLWDRFAVDQWQPAVAGLRKMTCELATTGFTEQEWAAAKRNVAADLQYRAGEMAKVRNVDLARDLSHAIADGKDLIPPDEMLGYARNMLPRIDARSASTWWRRQWGSGVEHLRVEAPELAKVRHPEATIRAIAAEAEDTSGCKVRRSLKAS